MDFKLDGYVTDKRSLDNAEAIRGFIARLADHANMKIVNGPTVHSFKEGSGHPDAGLSAFAIIAESNICVHTWPEFSYVTIDLFSCKPFDSDKARDFCVHWLGIHRVERYQVDVARGGPPELDKILATVSAGSATDGS